MHIPCNDKSIPNAPILPPSVGLYLEFISDELLIFIISNLDRLDPLNIRILPPSFFPIKSHTFKASKNLFDSFEVL